MASKSISERVQHGVSSNSPLPPSVETAYYRKCIELKRRINEIEENNDAQRVKKLRIERAILKMRIERSLLLEQIANKMKENPDDSDDSNSPPPTPQEKPLRSKRGHRKHTPPPHLAGSTVADSSPQGGGPAQSTIDTTEAPRQPIFREYVPPAAAGTPPPANTNGSSVQLPSLASALPHSIAATRSYDPAYDDRTPNGDAPVNGDKDTEMEDVDVDADTAGEGGFSAINR